MGVEASFSKMRKIFFPALLIAAGLLLYARTLHYPFVYDDDSFIVRNPAIQSLNNVPSFFSDPSTLAANVDLARDNYRPLVTLSYALSYAAGGLDPFGYRLADLLLHIANGLLVFLLASSLLRRTSSKNPELGAFAAAAAFLAHPVQVETVIWASQRSNLLALFFVLPAFLLHIRNKSAGAASLTLLAAALFCKEEAVVLPLFLWLWEVYFNSDATERTFKAPVVSQRFVRACAQTWPYFGLVLGFVLLRTFMLGRLGQTGYWAGSLYFTLLTMSKGLAAYIRLMVWPHSLSLEYLFPVSRSLRDPQVLGSLAVIVAVLAAAWAARAKRPLLSFGLLIFLAGLLPVSNLVPIKAVIAERFLYFPALGFGLVLGDIVALFSAASRDRWKAAALALLPLAAYAPTTLSRSRDWESHKRLVLATLKTCPQSARMHYGLGQAYAEEENFAAAVGEFRIALEIDPRNDEASRGMPRSELQIAEYRKTIQPRVEPADALASMGTAFLRLRRYEDAISAYSGALNFSRGGGSAAARNSQLEISSNLAAAYAGAGRLREAVGVSKRLLAENPGLEKVRRNLALYERLSKPNPGSLSPGIVAAEPVLIEALRGRFPQLAALLMRGSGSRYEPVAVSGPGGELLSGFQPTRGYLGSSESYGELKPQERLALEALARRDRLDESQLPRFFLPRRYGTFAIGLGKDYQVFMKAEGGRAVAAELQDGTLVYTQAYDGVSAAFIAGPAELESLYWLKSPLNKNLSWRLAGVGVKDFELQGGDLAVISAKTGAAVLKLSPPVIFDSDGKKVDGRYALEGSPESGRRLTLSFDEKGLRYPLLIDPTWATIGAGSMSATRQGPTATLLPNGKVLVAGGGFGSSPYVLSSAEIYDPAAGTWATTAPMSTVRRDHTATLLANGKVLVAGGYDFTNYLSSAELYDPTAGTWTITTGSMQARRGYHTATLLPNGKVLVAGGQSNSPLLSTAELYDPAAQTWTYTSNSMSTIRDYHTATLLTNGKVLVAGGNNGGYLTNADLYDPVAGTWATTAGLNTGRYLHTATLLPNGKVLVAGGQNAASSAELYDPVAVTWTTTTNLNTGRTQHTATLLPSGQVLVAGGTGALSSTELYDMTAQTWTSAASLNVGRWLHTATLLPNGKILVAGGYNGSSNLSSAELYDPVAGGWASTGNLNTPPRYNHTATLLPNGKVLVAGGIYSGYLTNAELYASGSWTTTGSLITGRGYHTATLLPNGKVLVAAGWGDSGFLASAELYSPSAGTWASTGNLNTGRQQFTATLLPNGKVLVAGGLGNSGDLTSAELYNPSAGTWATTATGNLNAARTNHTATLLQSGKVLVAGGYGNSGLVSSAELYDPAAGTWATTGSLNTARQFHTATLLPNGQVLAVGGYNSGYLSSAELYNPAVGTWATTSTGNLNTARQQHTATLLPNGKVLVAGGQGSGNAALTSVEVYDMAAGTWTATASNLRAARYQATATLLPNGKVLAVGGYNGSSLLASSEQALYTEYDFTPSTVSAAVPVIATVGGSSSFPVTVATGAFVTVTGSAFTGVGGGSGGNGTQESAANLPRAYLRALDTGGSSSPETDGGMLDVSTSIYVNSISSTSFQFQVPASLGAGYYLLWIQSNATPSAAVVISDYVQPAGYQTMVQSGSSPMGWQWATPTSANYVPTATVGPSTWTWQLWNQGSGSLIPQGTPASWQWTSE